MTPKPVDTTQDLVIFPKPISLWMIVGCLAMASLGVLVIPLAWRDGA